MSLAVTRRPFIQTALAGLVGVVAVWAWWSLRQDSSSFLVYANAHSRSAIIIAGHATKDEIAAASLLSVTLAQAAGIGAEEFPVETESRWKFWQRGIYVGDTRRARQLPLPGEGRLERVVGYGVFPFGIVLRSKWPEDVTGAAGWFLEKQVGAHWFIPGPLGVSVPPRAELRLAVGAESTVPSFVSRSLGGMDSPAEQEWFAANRLQAVLAHGHSMSAIFQPEDVARMPELAPLLNWQKYLPTRPNEQEWQPNIAAPAAAKHAAKILAAELRQTPAPVAVRLAMNDSIRYDQSQATLALVGPPAYFRHKPDYSNLVFGFANQVARQLSEEFPDRFVTTYAYDWTEDVPKFRVEPNVVPYLTADRSQWFDPAFALEDKDLMKRWVAAGPKVVGIYDYYEGAPFLVPRSTLYAVSESIPFAHAVGVRAYYAENSANWGIDGPKSWLAAQLLWDAKLNPAGLLDTYYREYWQEAVGPMREFFDLCDRQWLEQPLPSYWLKYFKDEHQALRFPPPVRRELLAKLGAARRLATQEIVRSRLEFTAAAFAVTDAFCAFCEARDKLSALAFGRELDAVAVLAAAQATRDTRAALAALMVRSELKQPLAMRSTLLEEYTRNDPRRRALWRLRQETNLDQSSPAFAAAFGDLQPERGRIANGARELAVDGALMQLRLRSADDFTALDWVKSGAWRGHGEPYETRKISPLPAPGGIRFEGCKQESLAQWHAAVAENEYIATAQVRAKVSPGNMTFLIVTFLDEKGKYIGLGSIDRLPVGDWLEPVELAVLVRAPAGVKQIGLGVRVLNQVGEDFAEFTQLSLKRRE